MLVNIVALLASYMGCFSVVQIFKPDIVRLKTVFCDLKSLSLAYLTPTKFVLSTGKHLNSEKLSTLAKKKKCKNTVRGQETC